MRAAYEGTRRESVNEALTRRSIKVMQAMPTMAPRDDVRRRRHRDLVRQNAVHSRLALFGLARCVHELPHDDDDSPRDDDDSLEFSGRRG